MSQDEHNRKKLSEVDEVPSCDPAVSRKEFLRRTLAPVIAAGAVLAVPRILDKFLVPPVYAAYSGGKTCYPGSASDLGNPNGSDTNPILVRG